VDVLDYFPANNTAYIVMEYLEGENLKDYTSRYGLFSSNDIIELMLPVMKSLKSIHSKGVIRRDISPDNIMFTRSGKLKLMDFGSARYYTNEDRELSVVLKQGFAPEEQYRKNG
ncbi:MAG: protein kinase, partial [Ruminococcus sp.]|nr:protein kinase [Ruminococcus sp.]